MQDTPFPNLIEDPRFQSLIDGFADVIKTSSEQNLNEGRKRCTDFFLSKVLVRTDVESITTLEIEGVDNQKIPLRIYTPTSPGTLPVIVYFHRGGWIFGNIEEADPICRMLAHHLQCVVASVEYRLAPENPFPKPLDDCYTATQWISKHASQYGGDPKNLIVCGESAGGNLAAAVTLMAKEKKGPHIASQLLIYPMITSTIQDAPYDTSPDRHFITKEGIQFMWNAYVQSPEHAQNPYASLDHAQDLSGLPPAVIVTAEYDPLHQEAECYAEKLRQANVDVRIKRFPGVIHGFLDLPLYDLNQKIAWIKEIQKLLYY
ncbi:MAG: alpha/beta hydrolase [Anaplasmataceae bacterium]|nr:alpha/beta hydrolase [Anaplasmataceae bacterium]